VTVDCDLFKSLESPFISLESPFILDLVGLAIPSTNDKTHKGPNSSKHRQDKVQNIYQRHLPRHTTNLSPQKGTPMTTTLTATPQPHGTIIVGDALNRLQELETSSIDCVITSPPYFRLRNYQHHQQLGLEDTIQGWVNNLLTITDEIARILVPTGTLWLNLGDSYSTHQREGAPRKSLLLGPERLALTLIQHGWTLRNKIIWAKTNSIPSPVTDRLSCTHEVIYLLTRNPRYYFNLDDIRQPPKTRCATRDGHPSPPPRQPRAHTRPQLHPPRRGMPEHWRGPNTAGDKGLAAMKRQKTICHPLGKNPGDVWRLAASGPHWV